MYGNITFADELDFNPTELDIVYDDNDIEVSRLNIHITNQ